MLPTAGHESSSHQVQRPSRPVRNGTGSYCQQFRGELAMHFCLTGQYTPRALNAILENPTTNRQEAARKLIEAAGGKLVSMYSVAADGPGVLVIFDVPDPSAAPAISGLTVTAGTLQNVKLVRLFTQDEIKQVRQNAAKLRPSYSPPGS
ncbi:GYD domain-containing protein [Bradyrhizobium sp. CB1015]|uniref:GYD domain-containing protein n=2 Tax=Nitrobacteraceae TaxID=41294 RepID=UPI0021AAB544|nr:GYD domain-containing protein [Bradyrhizobium sp. CB1015]UWU91825.1 GYD domain-containing protein [Bradyrhizobium sp. CB1015]